MKLVKVNRERRGSQVSSSRLKVPTRLACRFLKRRADDGAERAAASMVGVGTTVTTVAAAAETRERTEGGRRARVIEWMRVPTMMVGNVVVDVFVAQRLVLTMVPTVPKMFMVVMVRGAAGPQNYSGWEKSRGWCYQITVDANYKGGRGRAPTKRII